MSFWEKIISKIKGDKNVGNLLKKKIVSDQVSVFGKTKRFDQGLRKSASKLSNLFISISKKRFRIDEELFEELFDLLVSFDVGNVVSRRVIDACKEEVRLQNLSSFEEVKQVLIAKLITFYIHGASVDVNLNCLPGKTNVFLVVGVNGVGKTSSIAKIANQFVVQNKRVLLVAGDTFRAAACEQLERWAKKLGCDIVLPKFPHQDCAAVVYDGVNKGLNECYDLVICDTSGRQQNKKNLMAELQKIRNVTSRIITDGPHEVLLVIDATTGQNGLKQAIVFNESTKVTGIVLTKVDSSSKGGIIFAIKEVLNIPVKLVGFGEKLDDIAEFDLEEYVLGLIQSIQKKHDGNLTESFD